MTETDAKNYMMPFGKYFGRTLYEIVTSYSDGAQYLDYIVGTENLDQNTKEHLEVFLKISWVSRLVDEQIESSSSSEPPENKKRIKNWWEK